MQLTELNDDIKEKLLEVYYYIDLNETHDIEVLERCLRVFLNVNKREYTISKFVNCNLIKGQVSGAQTEQGDLYQSGPLARQGDLYQSGALARQGDVIKRGLMTFNDMVNSLKLKTTNDVWMFYISNGNIKEVYENVFVILLNKEPMFKRSYYVINKTPININTDLDKDQKLTELKLFNKNLQELLSSEKTITYTNLD